MDLGSSDIDRCVPLTTLLIVLQYGVPFTKRNSAQTFFCIFTMGVFFCSGRSTAFGNTIARGPFLQSPVKFKALSE